MSEQRKTLTVKGQQVIRSGLEVAAAMANMLPIPQTVPRPHIYVEICLLESGKMPKSYERKRIWIGHPDMPSFESVQADLEAYGYRLARRRRGITTTQLKNAKNVGHYVINLEGSERRVMVIVAGPSAEACRKFARLVTAGVTLAAHYI